MSVRPIGRLLFAVALMVFAPMDADAEIDRVSIQATLEELFEASRARTPDRAEISLPINELVSMLPDMARVVLPDGTQRRPANIRATFAVKEPGGEIGDTKTVRMTRVDDQTYVVARRSKRTFRSWLLKRPDDLY